ncbi:MAG: hypothetical protein U1E22_05985 [Coriobacteriia bacterium]|nr:hypothetical protein [Coriobacteriia bacterium]
MELTKLDVATSQLETAIRLYFDDDDPVSIHTLASAASDLIRDIGRPLGHEGLTARDWALEIIKPEYRDEVRPLFVTSQNFFKHADRDPHAVIDFNPEEPRAKLLDTCMAYQKLTLSVTPLMQLFEFQAALTWAQDFFGYPALDTVPGNVRSQWAGLTNPEFRSRFQSDLELALGGSSRI